MVTDLVVDLGSLARCLQRSHRSGNLDGLRDLGVVACGAHQSARMDFAPAKKEKAFKGQKDQNSIGRGDRRVNEGKCGVRRGRQQ